MDDQEAGQERRHHHVVDGDRIEVDVAGKIEIIFLHALVTVSYCCGQILVNNLCGEYGFSDLLWENSGIIRNDVILSRLCNC